MPGTAWPAPANWNRVAEMPERSFRGLFFAFALIGLLLDQTSKYRVFDWLRNTTYYEIVPVFKLEAHRDQDKPGSPPVVNQGALFGFLRDHKEQANYLFAAVSIAA